MNKLLILIFAAFVACTNTDTAQKENKENKDQHKDTAKTIQLNNGVKYKADSVTKKHVAEMLQVITDTAYNGAGKALPLAAALQSKADALVKDCTMQGTEHEALHTWLKELLKGIKELKEDEKDEYTKVHQELKQHLASFYNYFE